jgi:PEP-CTERM motif
MRTLRLVPYMQTVSLTTLKLSFVPEPGTLLLLAAGGLALLGYRRRR